MKKTISIHIKGLQFIVEENAYDTLQSYLNRLDSKLGNTQGKSDIIEDIELRIAEIFTDVQADNTNRVIVLEDVEKCIALMGEPEEYIEGADSTDSNSNTHQNEHYSENYSGKSNKKLFRDLENAKLAGVCSGLATYFGIDSIVVRILFLLFLFFGGFGFPLYIILWAVLPKVNTNVDRLRMQGRPITVENVREEVEMAAKRMTSESEKFSRNLSRESSLQNIINSIGRIIRVIIGLFLLFFGISGSILFFCFVVFQINVLPVSDMHGLYSLYQFAGLFWESDYQISLLWWVGTFVSLILLTFMLVTGIRFIFNYKYSWYKYMVGAFIFASVTGVALAFYSGISLSTNYMFQSEVEKKFDVESDRLHIELVGPENKLEMAKNVKIKDKNRYWLAIKNGYITQYNYRIKYRESPDSLYHLISSAQSNGSSQDKAFENASNIKFNITQKGDTFLLPKFFAFPLKDKIRGQDIDVYVEIPNGRSVVVNGREINLAQSRVENIDYEEQRTVTMTINDDGEIDIWD